MIAPQYLKISYAYPLQNDGFLVQSRHTQKPIPVRRAEMRGGKWVEIESSSGHDTYWKYHLIFPTGEVKLIEKGTRLKNAYNQNSKSWVVFEQLIYDNPERRRLVWEEIPEKGIDLMNLDRDPDNLTSTRKKNNIVCCTCKRLNSLIKGENVGIETGSERMMNSLEIHHFISPTAIEIIKKCASDSRRNIFFMNVATNEYMVFKCPLKIEGICFNQSGTTVIVWSKKKFMIIDTPI